ncbi:MAG: hypothetical protein R3C05_16915 [Pirellulaceae bacterium]
MILARLSSRYVRLLLTLPLVFSGFGGAMIEAADMSASLGLDGFGRAGAWAECRVQIPSGIAPNKVIVETFDGDGVAVGYHQPTGTNPIQTTYFQASASDLGVRVSLLDGSEQIVASTVAEPLQLVPSAQKWIVAVGDPLGIQSSQSQQGRLNYPVVSQLSAPDQFPRHWLGYSGVDLMVLPGSHAPIVNGLEGQQQEALAIWLRQGGRILLTLGDRSAPAVESGSWLREKLGILIEPEVVDIDPRAIESFANTQAPLAAYGAIRLPDAGGLTVLTGRTTDRQTVPIAKEYLIGLGRVFVIAGDLDAEPFASWPDLQNLMTRFLPDALDVRDTGDIKQKADVGYKDFVGQIRRTLDRFDTHWVLPFRWFAGLLVLYLALIGPLDYWLVNRLLGRPLIGWVTFPIVVVAFVGLAFYGAKRATPEQPLANQFSVVDIDADGTFGRGFAWSQYLTSDSTTANLSYRIHPSFAPKTSDLPTMGWFGVPGNEFGGLSAAGVEDKLPPYRIELDQRGGGIMESRIVGLPMATASTKGLAAWWKFETSLNVESQLRQRRGTDLLGGPITNPLPLDLLDGVLVYRGWAYLLPTRFASGSQLPDVSLMTSKNVRWRLTRRSVDKGSSATEPWNPEMVGNLDRLLEIAMLYETAGGLNYAQLSNRVLHGLDLSHVLDTENAILIGRCEEPLLRLNVDEVETNSQRSVSLVRVVIPVETR